LSGFDAGSLLGIGLAFVAAGTGDGDGPGDEAGAGDGLVRVGDWDVVDGDLLAGIDTVRPFFLPLVLGVLTSAS